MESAYEHVSSEQLHFVAATEAISNDERAQLQEAIQQLQFAETLETVDAAFDIPAVSSALASTLDTPMESESCGAEHQLALLRGNSLGACNPLDALFGFVPSAF